MDKKKKTILAIALSLGTVVLAVIAVITALKLKQISKEEIKPTVPEEPKAAEVMPLPTLPPAGNCYLVFGGPTETPTPTPTPTPVPPECWDECVVDSDCPGSLVCQEVESVDRCVNPDCPEEEDCACPGETPTPTPTGTPTPTPTGTTTPTPTGPTPTEVALPEAGFSLPTLGAVLGGLLLIVASLLFAL